MSITPTAVVHSAGPRPYAGVLEARSPMSTPSFSTASLQDPSFGASWVCIDHMSVVPNSSTFGTTGSKRLDPGSLSGVLT